MQLNEICEFIVDCPHSTAPDEGIGYPLIRTPNVGKGRLILDGVHRVSERVYVERTKRGIPQDGDIILAREAPAGNVALITNCEKVCLGQRTVLIRPNHELVNSEFLVYYLLAPNQQYQLLGTANGATVAHINLPVIRKLPVELPEREIQDKIAKIISTYDNLIENNQKQIKLLEEAAQRLYKEWFVDLRFLGYEDTPIVDGVPEGWKKAKINDVFQIKYGKTLPISKISTTGTYPVYGANGVIGYYNEKNCDEYVVLITSRGNGSGDILRTHDKESFVTNNSFIVKSQFEYMKIPFIHQLMKHTNFKSICTGSAQPQLTNNSISSLVLMIPSKEVIEMFCNNMLVFYDRVEWLLSQNKLLIEARDRLLPKLMGREIEV